MTVMQTIKNDGRRIRIQERADETNYITYSAVESITKEWDIDTHTGYYVLHMDNGETASYNKKEWEILREEFITFM